MILRFLHRTPLMVALSVVAIAGCRSSEKLGANQHVVDHAHLLKGDASKVVESMCRQVLGSLDVDLVVVTVPALEKESLSDHANRLFQKWHLGQRTRSNRGVLLLIAVAEKGVRLHTSYDMETLLTDGFISQVEHEQLAPYFQSGYLSDGITATTDLIAKRIADRVRTGAFNPSERGPTDISGFHAGGGGAQTGVSITNPPAPAGASTLSKDLQAYFAAQPTPGQTWERVLEWATRHIKDVNIGIFDERVRRSWDGRPVTEADQNLMFSRYRGKTYEVRQQGDFAAIVYPDDPEHLLVPMFLKRGPEGWQMDGSMYSNKIFLNERSQWRFITMDHPYRFAFTDFVFADNRFMYKRLPNRGGHIGFMMYNGAIIGRGVLISEVYPGYAAANAKLEPGDIVVRYNGTPVNEWEGLVGLIRATAPGERVTLDIVRGAYHRTNPLPLSGPNPKHFTATTYDLNPPKEMSIDLVMTGR